MLQETWIAAEQLNSGGVRGLFQKYLNEYQVYGAGRMGVGQYHHVERGQRAYLKARLLDVQAPVIGRELSAEHDLQRLRQKTTAAKNRLPVLWQ